MVIAIGTVTLVARPDPVTAEGGVTTVRITILDMPVADSEPILDAPDQYVGIPGTPPDFDTSQYGPDLTFRQDVGDLRPLQPQKVLRAVYLGHDAEGEPYYIWHRGSQSFFDVIGQVIADFGSFGRLMTSYGTERTGPGILRDFEMPPEGLAEGSIQSTTGQPTVLVAEWHALPPEVSLVAFYLGDSALGWQTPVSGTAAIRTSIDGDARAEDVSMLALDTDGGIWDEISPFGPRP